MYFLFYNKFRLTEQFHISFTKSPIMLHPMFYINHSTITKTKKLTLVCSTNYISVPGSGVGTHPEFSCQSPFFS